MQRITPCLWFDSNAEEAARSCTPVLRNSELNIGKLKQAYDGAAA